MRPTSFWFRVFIALSYFLALAGIISDTVLLFSSSETLSEALQEEIDRSENSMTMFGWFILGIIFVISIVGTLGLFFFRRWGRALTLYSLLPIMVLLMVFVREPWLTSMVSTSFYEMSSVFWGAVLVMAYWSPIKERFELN